MIDCACQKAFAKSEADLIAEFKALRESCPVLRTILIPDFIEWDHARTDLDRNNTDHDSILFLAFKRRYLHRLTLPIHKYLLDGEAPRSDLTQQYKKDLQERWFIRPDPLKRHRNSKGYLGRLSELLVAEWAENTENVRITGLEATGKDHDILTVSTDGSAGAIEVKFIGTMDSTFEKMLAMKIFGGAVDVPTASDFLLTRIYEAAKQLADYQHRKTVVIVIDEMAWHYGFDAALSPTFGFIADLRNPKLQSKDAVWLKYLRDQKYYPEINTDLSPTILSLKERIHIFRLPVEETLEKVSVFPA
jgi:hypothetical protein